MTIKELSDYFYNKSKGLIQYTESVEILTSFALSIFESSYEKGYNKCSSDRKRLKHLTNIINIGVINEFYNECEVRGITKLSHLDKDKDYRNKFDECFGTGIVF